MKSHGCLASLLALFSLPTMIRMVTKMDRAVKDNKVED
jgi:hypothetical protein